MGTNLWDFENLFNPEVPDTNTQPELTELWLLWRREWVKFVFAVIVGLTAVGYVTVFPSVSLLSGIMLGVYYLAERRVNRYATASKLVGDEVGAAVALGYLRLFFSDACALTLLGIVGCGVSSLRFVDNDGFVILAGIALALATVFIVAKLDDHSVVRDEGTLTRYLSVRRW